MSALSFERLWAIDSSTESHPFVDAALGSPWEVKVSLWGWVNEMRPRKQES